MELGSSSLTNRFLATMEGNGPNGITFTVSGGHPNYYITSIDGVTETQELFADYDLGEGSHTYNTLTSGIYKFVVGDTDGSVWQFGPITLPFSGKIIGISQSITPRVDVPYTITNCTFTWTDCYGGNGSGTISSGEIKHVCSSTMPTSTGCRLITNRIGDCSNAFCTTTTTQACTCYSVIPLTTTTTCYFSVQTYWLDDTTICFNIAGGVSPYDISIDSGLPNTVNTAGIHCFPLNSNTNHTYQVTDSTPPCEVTLNQFILTNTGFTSTSDWVLEPPTGGGTSAINGGYFAFSNIQLSNFDYSAGIYQTLPSILAYTPLTINYYYEFTTGQISGLTYANVYLLTPWSTVQPIVGPVSPFTTYNGNFTSTTNQSFSFGYGFVLHESTPPSNINDNVFEIDNFNLQIISYTYDCSCIITGNTPVYVAPTTTLPQPFNYYAIKMDNTNTIIGNAALEDQYINFVICQGYTIYQMYDTWSIISGGTSVNVAAQTNLALFVKKIWLAGLKPVIIVGDPVGPNPGDENVPFDRVRGWETTYALPGYELWGVNYEYEYWNIGGSSFSRWISAITYAATLNPNWNISVYIAGSLTTSPGGQADQILQAPIDMLEVTNYNSGAPNPSGVTGIVSALSGRAVTLGLTQDFVTLWSSESSILFYDQPFSGNYFGSNPPNFVGPLATWTSGYNALAATPYPNVNYTGGLCMFNFDTLSAVLPDCLNYTVSTTSTTSGGGGGQLSVSCNGPTCDNASNGLITVTPSSTNSPYEYKFTKGVITYVFNSSSNPFTYDGFVSGTWNVTVTDSLNNVETGSCNLTETFTHSFTATGSDIIFTLTGGFGSPNNTNYWIASADSNGNQDGRVFVSNIGNDGNYSINSLPNGSYVFLVGDTDGCVYQFASVTLPAASQVIRTISPLTLGDCTITWTDCYGGSGTVDAYYGNEVFVCSSTVPTSSCDLLVTVVGDCNHPGCTTTTTTVCLCYIIEITPPQIFSLSPTSGPVGTTVTITGENLCGGFQVTINGLPVTTFNILDCNTVTFVVPIGATSGVITVTTPGGVATSTTIFVVTVPPTPTPSTTQTVIPTLTATPVLTATPSSTPLSTPTPTATVVTTAPCNCTLLTYFIITPGVIAQSYENKVYLEFVRCGGVLTVTHELPVAATYFDYSDLPIKYCINTADLSSTRFYLYTSPSTTINVTSSVTTVRENGLCSLCVTSIPTPSTCNCANMSVFVSNTDIGSSDDAQVRIHYYDCDGILQEALISNVNNDVYLLDEFCVKTGGTFSSAIEVVYLSGGVLVPATNSYTVITGCCDNNSFLYRGNTNLQSLSIPTSSCTYQYTDCNGISQSGSINAGEQIAVCASFPPTGLDCSIGYTIQGDCTNCSITTTTSTCPCFTLISVNIDPVSLQNSGENPKKVYVRVIPCGGTVYDIPIQFTTSGSYNIETNVCASINTVEFYYIDGSSNQIIDTASVASFGDCCVCYDLTLSTLNSTNQVCTDLVTDPLINSPGNWVFNSYNGSSVASANLGQLEITEGTPQGNFIAVAYGDGTQFPANECLNGAPVSIQLTYDIEIHPNIIDGLGEFKLYFSDNTGLPTLPGAVTIIDFGQLAPGANPTGTITVTPPPYPYYIWIRYLRANFAPTNAPIIPGRFYPIIQSMTIFSCRNASWIDCNGCPQEALVIPGVNVNACVLNGDVIYEQGITITNNGICTSAAQRVGFTTTTTTACHKCFYINYIFIHQDAIDTATNGTVYFQYEQCVTEQIITLSFTEAGSYYLDGSDCIELLGQRQFYIIIQAGDLQTFINFDDYCYYLVGGECCFPEITTTTTLNPPGPIVTTTTTDFIGTTTTTTCPCVIIEWVTVDVNPQDYDSNQIYLRYQQCGGSGLDVILSSSGTQSIQVCSDRSYESYLYGYIGGILYSGSTLGQIVTGDCCP